MEINQIRYFVETCNQSSMAKAAESLHITQQGISVAIRKLEEELQCVLFYRKWNGLVLTEAGRIFKAERRDTQAREQYLRAVRHEKRGQDAYLYSHNAEPNRAPADRTSAGAHKRQQ